MSSQLPNSSDLPSSADIPGPEQLSLRYYPDPILHRCCQPLGLPDDNARACIGRMFDLMYEIPFHPDVKACLITREVIDGDVETVYLSDRRKRA